MTKLTSRQRRFVEEYLVDLNATQAAIRAGYSPRTAGKTGPQNMTKAGIRVEIERAQALRAERTEITQDRALREIARLAFSDVRKLFDANTGALKPIQELDDDIAAAVASLDVKTTRDGDEVVAIRKIKLWDKNSALEKIAKHLGMFGGDGGGDDTLDRFARALRDMRSPSDDDE